MLDDDLDEFELGGRNRIWALDSRYLSLVILRQTFFNEESRFAKSPV